MFRRTYYPPGFPCFTGHDLTPGSEIELSPTTSLCQGVGIPELSRPLLSGYPDPTSGAFRLSVGSSFASDLQVVLTDMRGARVIRTMIRGPEVEIDFSPFPAGSYLLQVSDAMGHVAHLVVMRIP